jgi:hypothetical protein
MSSTPASFDGYQSYNAGAYTDVRARSEERMNVILDEKDHVSCSHGNRRALLSEKMESLRGLARELELEDWKYAVNGDPLRNGSGRESAKCLAPTTLTASDPDCL